MKLNKELIQQLRNGEIAVENNGTVEQLREVLKAAFPEYEWIAVGSESYYYLDKSYPSDWDSGNKTNLPTFKISDFYQPELFTGWAKDDNDPKWMFYFKNDIPNFGFNAFGSWREGGNVNYSECQNNRPATHEEIERHLIQEAKRRGYKEGITCLFGIAKDKRTIKSNCYNYKSEGIFNGCLLIGKDCIFSSHTGQWAEIVEQPAQVKTESNPIKYLVDDTEYSLNYQELKAEYDNVTAYTDHQFMANLPQIAHLACAVAYLKGLGTQATIGDKGIIHELIHLMTSPEEPTNDLKEIRDKFNKLIQLV